MPRPSRQERVDDSKFRSAMSEMSHESSTLSDEDKSDSTDDDGPRRSYTTGILKPFFKLLKLCAEYFKKHNNKNASMSNIDDFVPEDQKDEALFLILTGKSKRNKIVA